MNARKKWMSISACLIAASLSMTGCGHQTDSTSQAAEQTILPSVEVTTVEGSSIQEYQTISSNISANDTVSVIPKASGTVKKVYVKVGDTVKAGDLLFEIDPSDIELQVKATEASIATSDAAIDAANAGIEAAKANKNLNTGSNMEKQIATLETNIKTAQIQYDELVKQLASTRTLFEEGFASQHDVETLENQVATAEENIALTKENLKILKEQTINETTQVSDAAISQAEASKKQAEASKKQAQASLESSRKQLAYTKVIAEVNGVVSNCAVTEGGMAASSSPALTLVDIDHVKISFNVTDDLINKIKVGTPVNTTIKSLQNQTFEGKVTTVSPTASGTSMLYPIEVVINNPKHLLKPGMFATSQLILNEKSNVISVPIDTVIQKDDQKYVYTLDANNTAHKVLVETGIENDTHIEILSGLNIGDKVIVKGQDYIEDNSKVNVVTGEE